MARVIPEIGVYLQSVIFLWLLQLKLQSNNFSFSVCINELLQIRYDTEVYVRICVV